MQDVLELIGSARGRKPSPLVLQTVRPLTEADADMLLNPPALGAQTSAIATLRHSHHMLARLLAEGRRPGDCSVITGYSLSRISILQQDPTFKELVEYYHGQVEVQYVNVHERLASLGLSSLDELQERLDANPDDFSNTALRELAELCLDRSIAPIKGGPKGGGAAVNVVVQFTGAEPGGPIIDNPPQPKAGT